MIVLLREQGPKWVLIYSKMFQINYSSALKGFTYRHLDLVAQGQMPDKIALLMCPVWTYIAVETWFSATFITHVVTQRALPLVQLPALLTDVASG